MTEAASLIDRAPGVRRPVLDRSDLLRGEAFVGGKWLAGNVTLEVRNPATGALIAMLPYLGEAAAEDAVAAAAAAFPDWKAHSARERATILRRWYERILANTADLARLMTAEQGKPLAEAEGEVRYAAAFVEWLAEEARRTYGDTIPGHAREMRLRTVRQPVGVVAAITPWNFPLAMITRKVAPALAAGCTVVLKPSELTPLSALALARLAEEAGVPSGVLNVVFGDASAIGRVLTDDPRVRKLSFTGSTSIGKMLASRCMATVKRVSLELGGNAPFIVFDDADIQAAVDGAIASKFRNTGQTCVCANRFLVQAGIHDAFADHLAARVRGMKVGDGLAGATDQGPLIERRALDKAAAHVADARAHGATLLVGGEPLAELGPCFFAPTVLTGVSDKALLNREETFGPVAGIIRFEQEEEALAIANDTAAGLAAYVFTRDGDRQVRMAEALDYGMVGINTGLISTEVAPFGGIKESGLGREGSRHGTDDYLDIKLIAQAIRPAGH